MRQLNDRLGLGALGLLALGASALAILLASDVRGWRDAVAAGDASFARAAPASWTPETAVPFGAGRWLLGVGHDLAYRHALALYRKRDSGSATYGGGYLRVESRGRAESALASVVQNDPNPRRASRAATLLGVLAYGDPPVPGVAGAPSPQDVALADFRNALRLDPANDTAKADLELALVSRGIAVSRSGKKAGRGKERGGNRGAAYGASGRGY
jgi:hypothetical protein